MSQILEAFHIEQAAINKLLSTLQRLGVHTMEGRNQLLEAKDKLLVHLKKQVDELYPQLEKASQEDPNLKPILENLRTEMKEISTFCVEFFEKYAEKGGGIEFLRDFERLQSTIESRIEEEATILEENNGQ